MATIDLTAAAPAPRDTLDGLPRRLTVTIAELRLLAERAGGAPLPFDVRETSSAAGLASRLGPTGATGAAAAFDHALTALPDAAHTLERRGLLTGPIATSVASALGVLATPDLAIDVDVSIGGQRAHAWHRRSDGAVTSLATADGLVHELAWFGVDQWSGEISRVLSLPSDFTAAESGVPDDLTLPFELLDAGSEATRAGRADLVSAMAARHLAQTADSAGRPLDVATASTLVQALVSETRGRARLLVARTAGAVERVGVVSLVLLADGWRVLAARRDGDHHLVDIRSLRPDCLASVLAPVLAEMQA